MILQMIGDRESFDLSRITNRIEVRIELAQTFDPIHRGLFRGTHYPRVNPAPKGKTAPNPLTTTRKEGNRNQ